MIHGAKNIIIIIATFLLVTLSYSAFLNKPLASDDYFWFSPSYAQNPWSYFVKDMLPNDPKAAFFRPLPILILAWESHFKNIFPVLPNSTNLFFHLLATAMVGLLISLPFKAKASTQDIFAPAAGMLIFALHPQATGAVCWISARFDLMCGLFGLMGVYAWLKSVSKPNVARWRFVAILCFVFSVLSKEAGVVFPAAVALWQLWRWFTDRGNVTLKNQITALTQLSLLVAVYFVYRYFILGGIGGYTGAGFDSLRRSGKIGYLLVMFWPFANMGTVPSKLLGAILIIITIAIILLINKTEKSDSNKPPCPWTLPLLLCICSCILLSLTPLKIKQVLDHAESRYSYIPLISFSILIGWSLKRLRSFRVGRFISTVILLLFLSFSIWAQQAEIAKWNKAGKTADSILNQIVTLVPDPPENATFLFGLPQLMATDRYYYVFGTGLAEALAERYKRTDLNILQWPDDDILADPPENSYIFKFDRKHYRTHRSFKIKLADSPPTNK